jgi:hypothetical protein
MKLFLFIGGALQAGTALAVDEVLERNFFSECDLENQYVPKIVSPKTIYIKHVAILRIMYKIRRFFVRLYIS